MTGGKSVHPAFWIALVALLLLAPFPFLPMQTRDSWPIDVNWMGQFAEQLAAGHWYPRWLPRSHGGSGAPVFYFYAPLPFYVGAPAVLAGLHAYTAVLLTFAAGAFAMGMTMRRWLEGARRPMLGVFAYMLMPYTLLDFYWRAAIGEFWAIVFIPLVALAMRDRRVVLFALAYAGLVFSHLPSALLVSVFLIGPYGLFLLWRDRGLARGVALAAGGLGGLMVAAIYVVPAMTLQEYINIGALFGSEYNTPSSWLFLTPKFWTREIAMVIAAYAVLLAASALLLWREQRLLAGFALAMLLVVTLGYGLWSIPPLPKVQFPWRALPIAGFAVATALANVDDRLRRHAVVVMLAVGAIAAPMSLAPHPSNLSIWLDRGIEVAEYLPPGVPQDLGRRLPIWAAHQDGIFYFPSLGTSRDGVYLDGPPKLRTLPQEQVGMGLSLLGLVLLAALWRLSRRVPWLAPARRPERFTV